MATISALTVPSEAIQAVCDSRGYAGNPSDNPAKTQFARDYIINHLKDIHRTWKRANDIAAVPLPTDVIIT